MNNIKVVLTVASHSLREYCKNKLFAILIIFSLFSIYASLLVGIMAVDQEYRVLTDFGLGLMELLAFVYIVYMSAVSITEEFKLKTIYLVLSRPVSKNAYLLGRIISLFALAAVILAFAGSFQLLLLKFRGFDYPLLYHKIILLMW
ncbi:MAG: ABC transporter permease, partial [Elusimicrobiales bacterium]|nr:ABC transporter permease [Elusimicrobiales bacterium]